MVKKIWMNYEIRLKSRGVYLRKEGDKNPNIQDSKTPSKLEAKS